MPRQTAAIVHSFAPVFAADARVLVLGSMPGKLSLQAAQYYAHPRNAFWPIMGELFGAKPELPYPVRLTKLTAAKVALWDVMRECERPDSSLDSRIAQDSVVANDFAWLFGQCPQLTHIFFNGSAAETAFRRHVRQPDGRAFQLQRLPSTSPAHAARNFAQKLEAWRTVTQALAPE